MKEFLMKFVTKSKDESGQALMEFALVVPLFLLIVLFIMEVCWNGYQRHIFNSSCAYLVQNFQAADINDTGNIEDMSNASSYGGERVKRAVSNKMSQSGLAGFDQNKLIIDNAGISFRNEKNEYTVPGMAAGSTNKAEKYTRYMLIEADMQYAIKPLTFVGAQIFGSYSYAKKSLQVLKVVQEQSRTQ